MATTFIIEDGTGISNANALISVAAADQIIENFGASSTWSEATDTAKENGIREATRYMDHHYQWQADRSYEGQALSWPRSWVLAFGEYVDASEIPERVKQACAFLAQTVLGGTALLQNTDSESLVKRTKVVIGPITDEKEYIGGDEPGAVYQVADRLVDPYVLKGRNSTDLHRA